MAIPKVLITGKVLTPDGAALEYGHITCRLSQAGSVLDGAVSQRVATEVAGQLQSDGTLPTGFGLVPNDAIVPSGTVYEVTFHARPTAAVRTTRWTETWQVASSPASIDVGAVPRLDVVPGIAVTTEAAVSATVLADATASKDSAAGSASAAASSEEAAQVAEDGAVAALTGAEMARDAANATGKVYPDTTTGLAATTEGAYFSVPAAGTTDSLILYRKESGVAVEKKRYPTSAAVTAVDAKYAAILTEATDATLGKTSGDSAAAALVWALLDQIGRSAIGINDQGDVVVSILRAIDTLALGKGTGDIELEGGEYNYELAIVDAADNVVWGLMQGARVEIGADSGATSDTLFARDQDNKLAAASVKGSINTTIERNVHKYNHVIAYGQSLSNGTESWPALSKAAKYGNLMLGGAVRPAGPHATTFTPVGAATLQPLVANVQDSTTGAVLSDGAVAALGAGNTALGEAPNVGMVNFAKRLWNDWRGEANDTARLFVTTNSGVGSSTIEQLSKGAAPELYNRIVDAVTRVQAIAAGEGVSHAVTALVWMQGEYNYVATYGGTTDKTAYKALLATLRTNLATDIKAITGQARDPAFLLYQTGASYTDDAANLSIGMAQWEFARENANVYLVGPIYPVTDKGAHLDPNGSRWYGQQLAKVFHRVVTLGQGWKPLAPRAVTTSGSSVFIDFHVPEPPLVFDTPYVSLTATDYGAKGFRVIDDTGVVTISGVSIVADTVVRLDLARALGANPYVWYADKTVHGGNGCLRDSDPTVAHDNYEYSAGTGQYAGANIAALVGKPYPLHNWCIAFRLPATWSE